MKKITRGICSRGCRCVKSFRKELAKIRNEKIGFVFQDFNLIKELTAMENIKLNLIFSNLNKKGKERIDKKQINQLCEDVLNKVGLKEHANKRPGQLSGGQKQRVAMERAIVNNPEIILADEPTGTLDQKTGQEIIDNLKELNAQGKTVIVITHDINIARQCPNQIEIRDGKIITNNAL